MTATWVRRAFEQPTEFTSSPLYRSLCRTVAADDRLLDLASRGRPGQYPTFLFLAAVHRLLLGGADHPLAAYFPTVARGGTRRPGDAGDALRSFCARYEAELTALIRTRLVQTNHVQRALALRYGLSVIAGHTAGPVHVIEVGASAGLNLRFDRYGYEVGGRRFGDAASRVRLRADLYGDEPLPDLDALPVVASVCGVDLAPVDVRDPDARGWLEALIWPENDHQRALLEAALDELAGDPPTIHEGDATDVLPRLAAELPRGEPRVVFHAATRIHVPAGHQAEFDAAIAAVAATAPMWHLAMEDDHLRLTDPEGREHPLARADGHLTWLEPLPAP
ncbi:MAG TPA: DUF2332 domain-containing protein [Streptosporangiales bacterium]